MKHMKVNRTKWWDQTYAATQERRCGHRDGGQRITKTRWSTSSRANRYWCSSHYHDLNINLTRQCQSRSSTSSSETQTLQYSDMKQAFGKIGLGTWAWGNRLLWGYDKGMDGEIIKALHNSIDGGVRLIDTADSYGTGDLTGRAEELLGNGLVTYEDVEIQKDVFVATKLAPYPTRLTRNSIVNAAQQSLDRLGTSRSAIDIGQLHWSTQNYLPFQEKILWDGIADCYERGLIKSVGLSNYGPKQLIKAVKYIREERGVPVVLAQAQVSILSRKPLVKGGLKEVCDDLGVVLCGYSPLALGLLTGKYSSSNKPSGVPRQLLFNSILPKLDPLLSVLKNISNKRNCSISQVALNYVVSKNIIPIVGCKNTKQAKENIESAAFVLDDDEVSLIEEAANGTGAQMVENIFMTD